MVLKTHGCLYIWTNLYFYWHISLTCMYITMHVHHTIKMTNYSRGKLKKIMIHLKVCTLKKCLVPPKSNPWGYMYPQINLLVGMLHMTDFERYANFSGKRKYKCKLGPKIKNCLFGIADRLTCLRLYPPLFGTPDSDLFRGYSVRRTLVRGTPTKVQMVRVR